MSSWIRGPPLGSVLDGFDALHRPRLMAGSCRARGRRRHRCCIFLHRCGSSPVKPGKGSAAAAVRAICEVYSPGRVDDDLNVVISGLVLAVLSRGSVLVLVRPGFIVSSVCSKETPLLDSGVLIALNGCLGWVAVVVASAKDHVLGRDGIYRGGGLRCKEKW